MRWNNLTRRRLLAGLGSTGVASMAGLTLTTSGALPVTQTTEAESTPEYTLEAEWRETYNGDVLEDTTVSQTSTGAAISLPNVLPGDDGVFSFELRLRSDSDIARAPQISLSLTHSENSQTEPEQTLEGEQGTDTGGELQEFLQVALWYDTGLASVNPFGANNGVQDFGEGLIADDAEGTLAAVADSLDTVSLGCLEPGESVTVTFGWAFPTDRPNSNRAQGDSVRFDFDIHTEQC